MAIALIAVFAICAFQLSGSTPTDGSITDFQRSHLPPEVEVLGEVEVLDDVQPVEVDVSTAVVVEIHSTVETRPPNPSADQATVRYENTDADSSADE